MISTLYSYECDGQDARGGPHEADRIKQNLFSFLFSSFCSFCLFDGFIVAEETCRQCALLLLLQFACLGAKRTQLATESLVDNAGTM